MLKKRLVAVLIIRDGRVVQSVRFKHTNVIHYDVVHAVEAFSKWSVDELVLLNVSRNADSREPFLEVVNRVSRHTFVPLAAGGWIQSEADAQGLLRNGADKLVVNTILKSDPDLVTALSRNYGKQCIVASMDVQRTTTGEVEVKVDRGRESTGTPPVDWAVRAEALGAGEIFFNSIDHDGARGGYDLATIGAICRQVSIPVIAFGGVFEWQHLVDGIQAGADAAAAANILHYTEQSTKKAKAFMAEAGIPVRREGQWKHVSAPA